MSVQLVSKQVLALVHAFSDEGRRQGVRDLAATVAALEEQKNGAYTERNALVAALSKLLPACLARHPEADTEWEDDWRWIVFIDAPTGQLSWHIHDSERAAFDHLEVRDVAWDGHTTPEKYERLAAIEGPPEIQCESCLADFLGERENSTCLGCGAVICQSCCDVFDHFKDGLHGKGNPTTEVDRLRGTVAALEERVAELEAPIDGLLGWFAQHARLCGAQEWIDRLNALAPTEEGGRDAE